MQTPLQASFLGLPAELRLKVYEAAFEDGLSIIQFIGCADGGKHIVKAISGPFVLLRVCRLIRHEVLPLRPPISSVRFDVHDFTLKDMVCWLDYMGNDTIAKIRKLRMVGYSGCYWGAETWRNGHYVYCSGQRGMRCSDHCLRFHHTMKDKKMSYGLCKRYICISLGSPSSLDHQNRPEVSRSYRNNCFQGRVCEAKLGGAGQSWTDRYGDKCASGCLALAVCGLGHPCMSLNISSVLELFRSLSKDHSKSSVQHQWDKCVRTGAAQNITMITAPEPASGTAYLENVSDRKVDISGFLSTHAHTPQYDLYSSSVDEDDDIDFD